MKLKFEGLDCPNCANKLEKQINKLSCIKNAKINFLKSYLEFESNDIESAILEIKALTKSMYPDVTYFTTEKPKKNTYLYSSLLTLGLGIIIGLIALLVDMPRWLYWIMFVSSALLMGYKIYYKAISLLLKGSVNENLLVTISIIGATAVGEHFDGLMVVALYSIGKILENLALTKSRKSIEELTNLKPEYANILTENGEKKVEPNEVNIGDIVIVRPGERVCIDGVIVEGNCSVDVQSLTGESLPIQLSKDSEILSGSIVLDGILKIKATHKYSESTVSRIMDLIENAQEKKSKTETFISKMTKYYTLGVMALSVVVWALVWAITKNFNTAIYRGMIFLVVSCPCAFAISVPLSYFSGIGNASSKGILIKGSNFLDVCAKINTIAFDKTGTLTSGEFKVVDIKTFDEKYDKDEIIYIASLGEQHSNHPLAKSILKYNTKSIEQIDDMKEVAGEGVYFKHSNHQYFVGRKNKNLQGTIVEVFCDEKKIGEIELADTIKSSSKSTCAKLKNLGIKTIMLSGDSDIVVNKVAQEIQIDEAYSNLLPQQKFEYLGNLKQNKDVVLGYVGDGLNDAPSLSLADVGFSMGIKGSPASIESSNIVLATDNPEKIISAIKISKFTKKIVIQNISLSAIIKVLFLTLGSFGITGMLSAVIADVGVTLVAILNSLRALKYNPSKEEIKTSNGDNTTTLSLNPCQCGDGNCKHYSNEKSNCKDESAHHFNQTQNGHLHHNCCEEKNHQHLNDCDCENDN